MQPAQHACTLVAYLLNERGLQKMVEWWRAVPNHNLDNILNEHKIYKLNYSKSSK